MQTPTPKDLALALAAGAVGAKALDPVMLCVDQLTTLTDYFLVVSGTSDRHVRAVADRIEEAGRALGCKPSAREGQQAGRWILLDYGDVIVHIFDQPTRDYYNYVHLWADAPRLEVPVPPTGSMASPEGAASEA